jgi:hypothetical protein
MISVEPTTAASGMPEASDFPTVTRSGTTPECSIPHSVPVRPMPACTSSSM